MCAEELHDGFLSFSGSRRMRVRIRRPEQATSDAKANPAAADERSAPVIPENALASAKVATTQERRPRPGVLRRGPGRRLSRDLPTQGLRARSPLNPTDVLRGVVILGIVAFALWVDWIVARAIVGLVRSWF